MGAGVARAERAFLVQGPVAAADAAQFEPAHAGVDHGAAAGRILVGRERADQRFMGTHVAVDELVEQHFADRVEARGGTRLRHGGEGAVVAEPAVELGDRDARQRDDAAVRRRVPVDVQLVQVDEVLRAVGAAAGMRFVVVVTGEDLPAARGRCRGAVEGGRRHDLEAVTRQVGHAVEALGRTCGSAVEHVGAVEGVDLGAGLAAFIRAADVGVVPHAAMRVVRQHRRGVAVEPPAAAHRVGGLRHEGAQTGVVHGQHEPAAGLAIVMDQRIAAIAGARVARRRERTEGGRARDQRAGLVVHVEVGAAAAAVDGVDHVVGADFDHRITRAHAGVRVVDADAAARRDIALEAARAWALVPQHLQLGQAVARGRLVGRRVRQLAADRRVLAAVRFADAHAGRPRLGLGQIAQVDGDIVRRHRLADLRPPRIGFRTGRLRRHCRARQQQHQHGGLRPLDHR